MTTDDATTLAGQIAALPHLPAAERARQARALVDRAKAVLSQVGDSAVAELAAASSWADAARELGVSESTVNKAVTRHRARAQQNS